ncbi:MAG: low molecular weight phosphotyrosine protein phosphatase [Cryobacterium sp.]|nr:low molecular weight phosphotyrosine protein phosphatase [Cryobacterium sp.]
MRIENPADAPELYTVCFVCTGNICRSPLAEAVFERMLRDAGVDHAVGVLSAGTGSWHRGEPLDKRAQASLLRGGYPEFEHRARRFDPGWFDSVDLVVALDRTHQRALTNWAKSDTDRNKIHLLLGFDPEQAALVDVPDPYYSDDRAFDRVLATVEQASQSLLRHVRSELALD